MTAIVTDNFRIKDANNFITSVSSDSIYAFIGKVTPWPDDTAPPAPVDSVQEIEYTHWDEMYAAKLISGFDVVNGIRRIDWAATTVYDEYDPTDTDLHRKDFYVLTDDYNVYKCIDNNGGGQSTTKPTGTAAAIFTTADSYKWKYMYSIDTGDVVDFLSSQFMPVRNVASNEDNAGTDGLLPYPPNGHGADNIKELGGYFAIINVRFEFDESGDFSVANDFRKIGLVENPYEYGTTTVATNVTYRQTTRFQLSSVTPAFTPDEIVEGATAGDTARVVEFDSANNHLYVKLLTGTFVTTNGITGLDSGATGTIDVIDPAGLEEYTGDILYIETRTPIPRDGAQTENITIILQF